MIRYKVTIGDESVQVEFDGMCELFEYLDYMKEQKNLIKAEESPIEWQNTID